MPPCRGECGSSRAVRLSGAAAALGGAAAALGDAAAAAFAAGVANVVVTSIDVAAGDQAALASLNAIAVFVFSGNMPKKIISSQSNVCAAFSMFLITNLVEFVKSQDLSTGLMLAACGMGGAQYPCEKYIYKKSGACVWMHKASLLVIIAANSLRSNEVVPRLFILGSATGLAGSFVSSCAAKQDDQDEQGDQDAQLCHQFCTAIGQAVLLFGPPAAVCLLVEGPSTLALSASALVYPSFRVLLKLCGVDGRSASALDEVQDPLMRPPAAESEGCCARLLSQCGLSRCGGAADAAAGAAATPLAAAAPV